MKRVLLLALLCVAGVAQAGYIGSGGVREMRKADHADGRQYYRITCNSGGSMVLGQRNDGRWVDSSGYATISDRFDGMSVDALAREACR
ncbi:MAG: hypothetical protein Q8O33_01700 [Pseudomonadota bacterium]|nr:hypothetical protein [Pseudomonadota bacterium]